MLRGLRRALCADEVGFVGKRGLDVEWVWIRGASAGWVVDKLALSMALIITRRE